MLTGIFTPSSLILSNSEETVQEAWQSNQEPKLRQALSFAAKSVASEQPHNQEVKTILKSTTERQLDHGLSKYNLFIQFIYPFVLNLKTLEIFAMRIEKKEEGGFYNISHR